MTTFLEDESSRQSSRPTEFYDIVLSTGITYRIAAGPRDLQVGNKLYKASPIARTNIDDSQAQQRKDVTISLPPDHPVVTRWMAMGVPPRQVLVTCWRKQERSGVIEQQWSGLVTSIECTSSLAKFTVPARTTDSMKRMLPTISSGPNCVHMLYDSMCRVDRAAFKVATTAILVDGRDVQVDLGDLSRIGNQWTEGGELLHVPTGERMTVARQQDLDPTHTLATLSLQDPIPELRTGNAIEIYAGCAHDVVTCNQKFGNQKNFLGDAYKPTRNPTVPNGFGVIVQE